MRPSGSCTRAVESQSLFHASTRNKECRRCWRTFRNSSTKSLLSTIIQPTGLPTPRTQKITSQSGPGIRGVGTAGLACPAGPTCKNEKPLKRSRQNPTRRPSISIDIKFQAAIPIQKILIMSVCWRMYSLPWSALFEADCASGSFSARSAGPLG